ncbi:MAG: hypothetical protein WD651_01475 [Acidimicrobiia bacterium]
MRLRLLISRLADRLPNYRDSFRQLPVPPPLLPRVRSDQAVSLHQPGHPFAAHTDPRLVGWPWTLGAP